MYYYPLTRTTGPESSEPLAVSITPSTTPFGPNSSFIPSTNFQFAWDATSLDLLRSCPRKYQLRILQGWNDKHMPPPLAFGIALHTLFETWHKVRAHGMSNENAILTMLHLALYIGETLPSGDNRRTKETLTRTVLWYMDLFEDDHAKTLTCADGTPMVEYSFAIPILTLPDGTKCLYCGHIDRAVHWQGGNYILDYKTSAYQLTPEFFEAFKPSGQMSGYNLGAKVALSHIGGCEGVVIDAVQLGVNFSRFRRHILSYAPSEVEEDISDIQHWITTAKRYADESYWPKNPTACGRFFKTKGGSDERAVIDTGCPFREICSKPSHVREIYLKGGFVQRNWDPLVSR